MKKAYIIPEIQIYDADAEEMLAGSKIQSDPSWDTKGEPTLGWNNDEDAADNDVGSLAKQGDFFCDNFEYELDF